MKHIYFLTILLYSWFSSLSQCTVDAGPDKFICTGGSATIGPMSPTIGISYSWSPAIGLNNPNIYNPTASPTSTTTYTLTTMQDNLLSNPGFESGQTGFSEDFNPCSAGGSGESCVVGSVTSSCTISPHAGSKMYWSISHNTNPSNYRVWSQTINVSQNVSYKFIGYVSNGPGNSSGGMNGDASSFEVRMIGNSSGTTTSSFNTSPFCNNWQQFIVNWNSGSNTQITIEIRQTVPASRHLFMDDLYFGCVSTDEVTVHKTSSSPSVTPVGPITYYYWYEGTIQIPLTATQTGQWYKNDIAITGATGTTYNATYSGSGIPTDTYKCVNACGTSNVVTINAIGCIGRKQYPVQLPPSSSCPATAYTGFNVSQVNLGANASYLWSFEYGTYWAVDNYNARVTQLYLINLGTPAPATEYVYTRALAPTGTETRMVFGVGLSMGCRTANPGTPSHLPAPLSVKELTLYPNPAKNEVMITSNNLISSISIIDATGRRIKNIPVGKRKQIKVDISSLKSGLYYVEVTDEKRKKTIKRLFIK